MATIALKGTSSQEANFLINGKIIRIDFSKITHIGVQLGLAVIYTNDNKYYTSDTAAKLLKRLPEGMLVRIHREFLVVPEHVDAVDNYQVIIGKYKLPINYFFRTKLINMLERVDAKPMVFVKKYKISND